jgi:hypothetical protein
VSRTRKGAVAQNGTAASNSLSRMPGSWSGINDPAFDGVGRSQMLPVLSREVVEGKQRVAILDQALDSLVGFDAPGFDEGVERGEERDR